jgi:hypothetical protein
MRIARDGASSVACAMDMYASFRSMSTRGVFLSYFRLKKMKEIFEIFHLFLYLIAIVIIA